MSAIRRARCCLVQQLEQVILSLRGHNALQLELVTVSTPPFAAFQTPKFSLRAGTMLIANSVDSYLFAIALVVARSNTLCQSRYTSSFDKLTY